MGQLDALMLRDYSTRQVPILMYVRHLLYIGCMITYSMRYIQQTCDSLENVPGCMITYSMRYIQLDYKKDGMREGVWLPIVWGTSNYYLIKRLKKAGVWLPIVWGTSNASERELQKRCGVWLPVVWGTSNNIYYLYNI